MTDKKRFFFDLDGTIYEWQNDVPYEDVCKNGYFRNLKVQENILRGAKLLQEQGFEVYIITATIDGNAFCIPDKQAALDRDWPELDAAHRIFVPEHEDKAMCVPGGVRQSDVLMDDYSVNLHNWVAYGGQAVKCRNHVNGTKGTWKGNAVRIGCAAETVARVLAAV